MASPQSGLWKSEASRSSKEAKYPEVQIKVADCAGGGIDYLNLKTQKRQAGTLSGQRNGESYTITKEYRILNGSRQEVEVGIRLGWQFPKRRDVEEFYRKVTLKLGERKKVGEFMGKEIEVSYGDAR